MVFSYIGFETVEIIVGEQQFIEIRMLTKYAEVEEVVVTALGVSRQKEKLAIQLKRLMKNVLIESRAPNILNAISGRSAGVQISQPDGIEGGSTRIVIRGVIIILALITNRLLWLIMYLWKMFRASLILDAVWTGGKRNKRH